MSTIAIRMRRLVEDHTLTNGAEFEFYQRNSLVFEATFRGEPPRIDFEGIGLRLCTWPISFSVDSWPSVVRFSGLYEGDPVLLYLWFAENDSARVPP